MNHPSRRRMIQSLAAASSIAAGSRILAVTTAPSTTQAVTESITADDIAIVEKALGRASSDSERGMMIEGVSANRDKLVGLRARHISPDVEPAVHFNPRLHDTKLPDGPSSCAISDGPLPAYDGKIESLAFATVVDLSRLIHAGKITSVQLTEMYLRRLKSIGAKLNCVVTLMEEPALAQARKADKELALGRDRGPLHGIPWGAKDMFATRGVPTTWGAAPYREQVFDADATVVARLETAGAVLLAKLSLGELAMGDVWFNGRTNNPWNLKEGSGGSSAGPCAATAAGLVGFALGSETFGSIISPCMANGTTGLRPTYGRVSRHGAMPLARTMDKIGPITRGVEDAALVLHAIHGADPNDPTAANVPMRWEPSADVKSLRVGIDEAAFDFDAAHWKDDAHKQLYRDALERIRGLVGELKPVRLPFVDPYKGIAGLFIACESASSFSELVSSGRVRELRQQDEGSWPNTFRAGSLIPAADYLRAQQVRTLLQREMADAMRDVDLYVSVPYVGPTIAYTNLTGHPSLVTRCGPKAGRPKLIEFIGALYREDAILRLGHAFEQALGTVREWPQLSG
jgi:Asp-tRNA(Asn)/Glu-tRNA(Gln) amidotransferase A subunit family amidase